MSQSQHVCYIGLGSNLGDSRLIFQQAVDALSKFGDIQVAQLYSSPPMGPQDQPNYLNTVVALTTYLEPLPLLDELQKIENQLGRVRLRHWGERTLDLDILLYDQISMQHPRLIIPHVGLMLRDFVVLPLLDLLPDAQIAQQKLITLDCVQHATALVVEDSTWYCAR